MMDIVDFVDFIDLQDVDELRSFRNSQVKRIRINPFEAYDDILFKQKYRFSKPFVSKILALIKDDLPSDSRGATIEPEIQVACALWSWARHQIQDDSGDLHGISQPAVSKILKNVTEALAKKAHLFISMPSSLEEQENVIRDFRSLADFRSVIGAIDCTHIRVKRVPGDLSEAYINRKGYYSINVQVVCDSQLKIRDVVASWRGSVHDSRIFQESALKERFESGEFHGRLLADNGYGCTPYIFTPLLNTNSEKEAYNKAHIKTRNTIERCFGLWKQRFRCLLRGMHTKLNTAKTTIVALAMLHNIAIDTNEDIYIVPCVSQHRRRQTTTDILRGTIIRRNFINQYF